MYPHSRNKAFCKAKDNDHWLRHLIEGESSTIYKNPLRIRAKYLENKFKDVTGKPWASELSGRALSLAKDIREKAELAATCLNKPPERTGFRFRHLAYASVKKLREEGDGDVDVYLEPTKKEDLKPTQEEDPAHANLVIIHQLSPPISLSPKADPKQGHEIFRRLAENFIKVCDEQHISEVEALRQ